ncbi:MAG TPA: GNAT family N-acetyltransferase [Gemmatimonadales bacterium]|jgi:GNAT superfamily N-acetyltransferase|nr:GNAT family N-acetyltransferase [Gemmatimonadales bacterium]
MDDSPIEVRHGEVVISTDRTRIDPDAALVLLRATHWGTGMSRETLTRAIANSICFGVYQGRELIGLGRAVTDLATYAYWTDVVIAPTHRGRGLGRWLSDCMLAHPELQGLRRVALLTRDAAGLYTQIGFSQGPGPLIYMERKPPGNAA